MTVHKPTYKDSGTEYFKSRPYRWLCICLLIDIYLLFSKYALRVWCDPGTHVVDVGLTDGKRHRHSLHLHGFRLCGWVSICVRGDKKSDGEAFLPSWENLRTTQCSLTFQLPAPLPSLPTHSEEESLWVYLLYVHMLSRRGDTESKEATPRI